jgi:NTP pyrophosphatase (non-canonical NTP hydrolase)
MLLKRRFIVDLDEYQKKAMQTAKPASASLVYGALGLSGEAGEVAEKIKKWIRDGNSDLANLDKEAMAKELGDVLWYIARISDLLELKMSGIAQMNIDKLSSRDKRGVIGGSGDNR